MSTTFEDARTYLKEQRPQEATYDKMLKTAESALLNQKINAYKQAKLVRSEADRAADKARERTIVDANASYAVQTGAYGANAENLARSGLTGSGYSDYLNSQAYATQRSEIQGAKAANETAKANAAAKEAQSRLEADDSYNTNLLSAQQESLENYNTNYNSILADAKDGASAAEILNAVNRYGISNDDAEYLLSVAEKAVMDDYKQRIASIPYAVSLADIQNDANLSSDQKNTLIEDRSRAITGLIETTINNATTKDAGFAAAEQLLDTWHDWGNGTITTEEYANLSENLLGRWKEDYPDQADVLDSRFKQKSGAKQQKGSDDETGPADTQKKSPLTSSKLRTGYIPKEGDLIEVNGKLYEYKMLNSILEPRPINQTNGNGGTQ